MCPFKVCLDAGHGGHDPGAVYKDKKEKDIALELVLDVGRWLAEWGFEVVYTRDSDVFVPLRLRAEKANNEKCAYFFSIHLNADRDEDFPGMPEATGEEIWYAEGSAKGEQIANSVYAKLEKLVTGKARGVKPGRFTVLTRTRMPAILIECGFIDNPRDSLELQTEEAGFVLAQAIRAGIQ